MLDSQFDSEKKVMKDLEKQYRMALLQINNTIKLLQSDDLTQSKIYRIQHQQALKKQIEAILEQLHTSEFETISTYLENSYTDAYVGAMYTMHGEGVPVITPIHQESVVRAVVTDSKLSAPLYTALGYEMDKLKKHVREEITRGIATSMSYEEIARNISQKAGTPLSSAKRVARTEVHRINCQAQYEAALESKAKGANVVKQWSAVLDGDVRSSHRHLDRQIRELDEKFSNGLLYPGHSIGKAEEVINCRCVANIRARWALGEGELQTMKERAAFFGLDKTKDFKEFKQKYLKAADYMRVEQAKKITDKGKDNAYTVDAKLVNSKKYHDKFESLTKRKAVNEAVYLEATRILEHRDGTDREDMVLLDFRTGAFVTGNMDSVKSGATGLTDEQYKAYAKHSGTVAIVHNHPNSSRPSYTDILTMYKQDKVDAVVAVGHDGSVHVITDLDRDFDIENYWQEAYNDAMKVYGDKDVARHKATDELYSLGVFKYERR